MIVVLAIAIVIALVAWTIFWVGYGGRNEARRHDVDR